MDDLLLSCIAADQVFDIVQEQRCALAIAGTECREFTFLDRGNEFERERTGPHAIDAVAVDSSAECESDSAQQVRLSRTRGPLDEERAVALTRELRDQVNRSGHELV